MKISGVILGVSIFAVAACKSPGPAPLDCSVAQNHVIHVRPDCTAPGACDPARIEKHSHHTIRWVAPPGQTIRVTMHDPSPDRPFEGLICEGGQCRFPCNPAGTECWAKVDEGFVPADGGSPFRYDDPVCSKSARGGDPGMIIFK